VSYTGSRQPFVLSFRRAAKWRRAKISPISAEPMPVVF
jgi:hypothetical protein